MITSKYLQWASYSGYEGPAFYGCGGNPGRYVCPEKPTQQDIILATITATEGGSWNLVNMYDKCRCTVGLIQWCEAGMFAVSDMLGVAVERYGPGVLKPLWGQMERQGLQFGKGAKGKWRFHFGKDEVNTSEEQTRMFFLDSSGKKGEWTDAGKEYARAWVLAFANLYTSKEMIESQKAFTVPRLGYFFTLAYGRQLLKEKPDTNIGRAFEAMLLSFAANNPTWAEANLKIADQGSKHPRWSLEWLIDCAAQLTNGPGVSIYPHRYNKIRPVLEKHYGIDLPDLAKDLPDDLLDAHEVQTILVHGLGYDLGAAGPGKDGVDGKWGTKSKTALMDFQRRKKLPQTGWPNAETNKRLLEVNMCVDLSSEP